MVLAPGATVAEIIAEYEALSAQADSAAARSALLSLEDDRFLNWQDWEKIRAFFAKNNFNGRLEIITTRLLKTTPPKSPKPYFLLIDLQIRSGRREDAYALLAECRNRFGDVQEYRWNIVNTLFETGHYQKCLQELQPLKKQHPEDVRYVFLEIKSRMKLGEDRAAKASLKRLRPLLKDPSDWSWYLFLARDLDASVAVAEEAIVQRVEAGTLEVSQSLLFAFIGCGLKHGAARIIKHAEPTNAWNIEHACYVFNLATRFGNYATSLKFGKFILAHDPHTPLRPQIEELIAGRPFLMA
jgi:tetratricopeptide (TPR) repeat protein